MSRRQTHYRRLRQLSGALATTLAAIAIIVGTIIGAPVVAAQATAEGSAISWAHSSLALDGRMRFAAGESGVWVAEAR